MKNLDTSLHKGLIVNIRGAGGSGKSTPPYSTKKADPVHFEIVKPIKGRPTIIATAFPKYKIIALGKYTDVGGGVDSLKTKEIVQRSLKYVAKTYPDYSIVFEGTITTSSINPYIGLFNELERKGFKIRIVYFNPPVEECIKRIYKRNGGKPINEKYVRDKHRSMKSGAKKFKSLGFEVKVVDNTTWKKKNCVEKFLELTKGD